MSATLTMPVITALDKNGKTLSGAKLSFFTAGTTTPVDVYTDEAATVAHPVPVIADSAGRFPQIFYAAGDYKLILTTAADVEVWTLDNLESVITGSGAGSGLDADLLDGQQGSYYGTASDVSTLASDVSTATTAQSQADWNAGTSTIETTVSPSKIKAAIVALNDIKPGVADAVCYETQTTGTAGGTATSGDWRVRTINDKYDPNSLVTISGSNTMTFDEDGAVEFTVPANAVGGFTARLYNVTDGSVATGNVCQSAFCQTTTNLTGQVTGTARVLADKAYRLEMINGTTRATDGFGEASSVGSEEVYSILKYFRERKNT